MHVIEVKNLKTGYVSTIQLPSVSREGALKYVERCNGAEFKAMSAKLGNGECEYSLRGEAA